MYKRIMVPTDGSELSLSAIRGAIAFAKPIGASLVLFTAIEPYNPVVINEFHPESVDEYNERVKAIAAERLEVATEMARAAGLKSKAISLKSVSPGEAIVQVSENEGCDCIFMASHGRKGIQALLLGSETQKVLAFSKLLLKGQ